jgi:hypothetical protein
MAKFLKTPDISTCIEDIIYMARNTVVLVSPYLQLSDNWLSALHGAGTRKVRIVVIYGKKKSQPAAKEMLAKIPGLTLYFMKQLHAKCYFNEQQMVIASMNLYAYSAKNNQEMGIMLDRMSDGQAFEDAIQETQRFVAAAQQEFLLTVSDNHVVNMSPIKHQGICIRCSRSVPYDPGHPLCGDCFQEMGHIAAAHHLAKYCHCCGSTTPTSLWYPVCPSCTRQQFRSDRISIAL